MHQVKRVVSSKEYTKYQECMKKNAPTSGKRMAAATDALEKAVHSIDDLGKMTKGGPPKPDDMLKAIEATMELLAAAKNWIMACNDRGTLKAAIEHCPEDFIAHTSQASKEAVSTMDRMEKTTASFRKAAAVSPIPD